RGKVFQPQDSFSGLWLGFEQMLAISTWQQSTSHRWREPSTVLLDEDVMDGCFRHFFALIEEKRVLETSRASQFVLLVIELTAGRLMAQESVFRGNAHIGNHNVSDTRLKFHRSVSNFHSA